MNALLLQSDSYRSDIETITTSMTGDTANVTETAILLQHMKLTLEQRLAHGGHPVLRWMMDNIYIRTDPAGNVNADKGKSTVKIDGAVATIMGLDRAIRCGNNTGASVYDDRGILFL